MHYTEFFLGVIFGATLMIVVWIIFIAIRAVRDGSRKIHDDGDQP